MPYLNSVVFYEGLPLGGSLELTTCVPRELGRLAAGGELLAGPLSVADYLRLADTFERLGHFGIATRGRAHSAILFSRRSLRQLDGALIAVSEETSTTSLLLRLLLEQRDHLQPTYHVGPHPEADALLLIGDDALRLRQANTQFPFEVDVAFEWWLWQHLPFVFAVWAVRKDAPDALKREVARSLGHAVSINQGRLGELAAAAAERLGPSADIWQGYLESFVYRLGREEESGLARFRELANAHHLL